MSATFISAGWPYLYDVPGLHNVVPMLLADVMARYRRWRGGEVFFLGGADMHGARSEYVAEGMGVTPQALVESAFQRTRPLLEALELSFDHFGRTDDEAHVAWTQARIAELVRKGLLVARQVQVAWCARCQRELPDRFVMGRCPDCRGRAHGNQCQNKAGCGRVLTPAELTGACCAICGDPATQVSRAHWALPLGAPIPVHGNAEVQAVIAHRPREVIVTRDFKFGVRVAAPDGREVSVDGWTDALLAKLSFSERVRGRELLRSADKLCFLGADGVPFYGVLLPELAQAIRPTTAEGWTIVPNLMFADDSGICSRSTGTGIWLGEALQAAPASAWRFYVLAAYAEGRSIQFSWERFVELGEQRLRRPLGGSVAAIQRALPAVPGASWHDLPDGRAAAALGEAAASRCDAAMARLELAPAMAAVLDGLQAVHQAVSAGARPEATVAGGAREALRALLPRLACMVPGEAARAWRLLGLRGRVDDPRLAEGTSARPESATVSGGVWADEPMPGASAARAAYQAAVAERRQAWSLSGELTSARAAALCGCPSSLEET